MTRTNKRKKGRDSQPSGGPPRDRRSNALFQDPIPQGPLDGSKICPLPADRREKGGDERISEGPLDILLGRLFLSWLIGNILGGVGKEGCPSRPYS